MADSKRSRKVLSLLQKCAVLDDLDKKMTVAAVARKNGVNESSIRTIRQNKEKIRKSIETSTRESSKFVA